MTEEYIAELSEKVLSQTGIIVMQNQYKLLDSFIKEKCRKQNIPAETFMKSITPGTDVFEELIKAIVIHETYFFREEKQFDFLKTQVFPKFSGKTISIWSAACSTGEEAISLLALALECGVKAIVFASDIDDDALQSLQNGVFPKKSFREDGKKYHPILKKYGMENDSGRFTFEKSFLEKIKTKQYNLISDLPPDFAEKFDIIFLRNVFIYFDKQTRINIINKITGSIKPDGKLIFSMNEIGCISDTGISPALHKTNYKSIFYFQKQNRQQPVQNSETNKKIKTGTPPQNPDEKKLLPETKRTNYYENKKQDFAGQIEFCQSQLAELNEKISRQIHEHNFAEAKKLVNSIPSGPEAKPFYYFFNGYVEYNFDNKTAAEIMFESSLILKPDFWPAFFYHGIVLKDIGKQEKANKAFDKCKKLLEEQHNSYDFILDSFSSSYIYSLCDKLKT